MSTTIRLSCGGWYLDESPLALAPAADAQAAAEKVFSEPPTPGEWFDPRPGHLAISWAPVGALEAQGEAIEKEELAQALSAYRDAVSAVTRCVPHESWATAPGGEDMWAGGLAL